MFTQRVTVALAFAVAVAAQPAAAQAAVRCLTWSKEQPIEIAQHRPVYIESAVASAMLAPVEN